MPYVMVGEENSGPIELYYEDLGQGPSVVLAHGYPFSNRSWEKQIHCLLEAGYRVVAYDRRGFGKSSMPASGYDYDTLAGDLNKLIAELGLRDVALFGLSTGGGDVARYMSAYGSGRVSKVCFISTILPSLPQTKALAGAAKAAILDDRFAFIAAFVDNVFNVDLLGGKLISDFALRDAVQIAAGASPQSTLASIDAWSTDFRADLAKIRVPTLVVHGDQDRIARFADCGARIHAIVAGSRLELVEGAPHGLTWTHADHLNPVMLDFLL
jgi:non-heme chloroperoxidase